VPRIVIGGKKQYFAARKIERHLYLNPALQIDFDPQSSHARHRPLQVGCRSDHDILIKPKSTDLTLG